MKQALITIAILLLSISAHAQKIEFDEVNEYNKRVMYTSWEKVNWKSQNNKLEVSMMLEGYDKSILLNWQSNEMVGAERDSEIVLLFDDSSEIILHNKAFSVSGAGKITTKNVPATQMGIQLDAKGEFRELLEKDLAQIRINTTSGEIVFPISDSEAESLRKMFTVFEKQLYK